MKKLKLLTPFLVPVSLAAGASSCVLFANTKKSKHELSDSLKAVTSKADFLDESNEKVTNDTGERIHSNFNPKNVLSLLSSNAKFHENGNSYEATIDFGINMDYINACLMYTAVNVGQTKGTNSITDLPIASTGFFDHDEFKKKFGQINMYIGMNKELKDFFINKIKEGKLFIYPIGQKDATQIKNDTKCEWPHIRGNAGQDVLPVFNYKICRSAEKNSQAILTNLWETDGDNDDFDQYHNIVWLCQYGPTTFGLDPSDKASWERVCSLLPTLKWATTAKKYNLQKSKTIHAVDLDYTTQKKSNPEGSIASQINELLLENIPQDTIELNVNTDDYSKVESESIPKPIISCSSKFTIENLLEDPNKKKQLVYIKITGDSPAIAKENCAKYCGQQNFLAKRIKVHSEKSSFHYFSPFYNDFFLASDRDLECDDYSFANGINAHQIYKATDPWKTPDIRHTKDPTKYPNDYTPVTTFFSSVSDVEYNMPEKEKIIRRLSIEDGSKTIASFKREKLDQSGKATYVNITDSDVPDLPEGYKEFTLENFNLFLCAQTPRTIMNFLTSGRIDTKVPKQTESGEYYDNWGTIVAVGLDQETGKILNNPLGTAVPLTVQFQEGQTMSSTISETVLLKDIVDNKTQYFQVFPYDNNTVEFRYSLPANRNDSGLITDRKTASTKIRDFAVKVYFDETMNFCDEEPNQVYQEYVEEDPQHGVIQPTDKRDKFLDMRIDYYGQPEKNTSLFSTSYTKSQLAPVKGEKYDPKIYDKEKWAEAIKEGALPGLSEEDNPSIFPIQKDETSGAVIAGPYSCGVKKPTSGLKELRISYADPDRICQTLYFTKYSSKKSPYFYGKLYDGKIKEKKYDYVDFRIIPLPTEKEPVVWKSEDKASFEYQFGTTLNNIIDSEIWEGGQYEVKECKFVLSFDSQNKDLTSTTQTADSFNVKSGNQSWFDPDTKELKSFSLKDLKDNNMIYQKEEGVGNPWYLKLDWTLTKEHLNFENISFNFSVSGMKKDTSEEGKMKYFEIHSTQAILAVKPISIDCSKPENAWTFAPGREKGDEDKCFKNKGDRVVTKFTITSQFGQKHIDPTKVKFTLSLSGGQAIELVSELIPGETNKYYLKTPDENSDIYYIFTYNVSENSFNDESKTTYELIVEQETELKLFGHLSMFWKFEGVQTDIPSELFPEWYSGEPKPEPIPPPPGPEPTPTPTTWWTIAHILGIINIPICLAGIGCCAFSINQHKKHKNDHEYDN